MQTTEDKIAAMHANFITISNMCKLILKAKTFNENTMKDIQFLAEEGLEFAERLTD